MYLETLLTLDSHIAIYMYLVERKSSYVGTDIGIKLLPAVGVSLLSKSHSRFM